jgi:hypothetical protein
VLGENAPPGPEDPYAFDPNFLTSFDLVESAKSPRFVKSHLHFSLLPQQLIDGSTKAKMVYVARNPKDTCVSFFHHSCMFDGYRGSLEEFVEEFITDNGTLPRISSEWNAFFPIIYTGIKSCWRWYYSVQFTFLYPLA